MAKLGKFRWGGISMFFHYPIVFNFIPQDLVGKTVVDAGCGKGNYGFLLRTTRDLKGSTLIGMDIDADYINFAKQHKIYDKYVVGSIDRLPFKDKSIDVFIAPEVIAHLSISAGNKLLSEIDRVCKGTAIVTTSNNYIHHPPKYKSWDAQQTPWSVSDFSSKGYRVYGFGLRLPEPKKRWQVKPFFAFQYLATPFTYFFPQLSSHFIAIKTYS